MDKYTIKCTPAQTKKALELGAHLEVGEGKGILLCKYRDYSTYKRVIIPTAEQMIGWLENQSSILTIVITRSALKWRYYIFKCSDEIDNAYNYNSRKEATLAAISAALDYLMNKKEIN